MESQNRDESPNRRREEALARRLGEALDRAAPRGTQSCPDAERIAAYYERALGPEETAQCEDHFAACSRCRKILAVLAASDDTPLAEKEIARLGELVAAARVPPKGEAQAAKPPRPSAWDWRARWLAPALGVAAVLAVWFAIRPPWRTLEQGSSGNLIAQARKNEPLPSAVAPPMDQFASTAPSKALKSDSASPPEAQALAKNRLNEGGAVGGLVPSAGVAGNAAADQKKGETEGAGTAGSEPLPPAPAAPPPPPPGPQADVQAMSQPAQPEPRAAANAPARALAAPSARAVAQQKTGAVNQSVATFSAASGVIVGGVLRSPSGTVSWRIGASGRIERSNDAGRTWTLQASPSQQEWLAGAAVSDTMCWIAGRNGAIARTTDGEHWEQIAPPSAASAAPGKLPDWIAVSASDAQTATITANDQHRYSTQDGGKTWQAQ